MKWTKDEDRYLLENYKRGLWYMVDNIPTKRSYSAIYHRLKKLGIKYMVDGQITKPRKMTLNDRWFSNIDSPNKAYFLGLLASDGCVYDNTIILNLNKRDEYIIHDFMNDIDGDHYNISHSKDGCCRITIYSKKMVVDLFKYGIIERKSKRLEYPNLREELHRHFIRGYIDGDGTIECNMQKRNYKVSIIGTKKFLSRVKEIVDERFDCTTKLYHKKDKSPEVYVLNIQRKVHTFLDWLYKDADRYLNRKYAKYKQIEAIFHKDGEIHNTVSTVDNSEGIVRTM